MFLFETFQKSKSDTLIMNVLKLFLKMGFRIQVLELPTCKYICLRKVPQDFWVTEVEAVID